MNIELEGRPEIGAVYEQLTIPFFENSFQTDSDVTEESAFDAGIPEEDLSKTDFQDTKSALFTERKGVVINALQNEHTADTALQYGRAYSAYRSKYKTRNALMKALQYNKE